MSKRAANPSLCQLASCQPAVCSKNATIGLWCTNATGSYLQQTERIYKLGTLLTISNNFSESVQLTLLCSLKLKFCSAYLIMAASLPEPHCLNPCSFNDKYYDEANHCVFCGKVCLLKPKPKNPRRWRRAYPLQCVTKLLDQAKAGNSYFDRVLQFRLSYMTSSTIRLAHNDCRVRYSSNKFKPPSCLPPFVAACKKKECEHHLFDLDLETAGGSCFGKCSSKRCSQKRCSPTADCNPFDTGDCDTCEWPNKCRSGLITPASPKCQRHLSKLLSKDRAAFFGQIGKLRSNDGAAGESKDRATRVLPPRRSKRLQSK